jgi:beta-N-acetylhexosaminidase
VGSAAILGCAGPKLSAYEAAFFRDADPFGFILFARNCETADQIRALCADLRATVGRDAPILIDQEGGRVQRLHPPIARDWPAPLDQAQAAGDRAADAMRLRYRIIAQELRALGIDVNCAPCADIAGPQTHPFLRNRCLGDSAARVIPPARAVAEGLIAGGVLPVVKHMPGHGRAQVDSHHGLPVVDTPPGKLEATDFEVFRALSDLPMAMTAHVVFSAIDDRPATLSPAMIALIRDRIGFQGLLMTDDLSMNALPGDIGTRAATAIAAGCDVALHCNGDMAEIQAVVAAAGPLTSTAQARADAVIAARPAPDIVDIAALDSDLAAIMAAG